MPGPDLVDGDGGLHAGLFPDGLPILEARTAEIARVREAAAADPGVLLIDFPEAGQTTTDYGQFRQLVANTAPGDLRYTGTALRGAS